MTPTRPSSGISRRGLLSTAAVLPTLPGLFLSTAARAQAPGGVLPSWNDGPTKQAILDFVHATIDQASPSYVPADDRVGTFDLDDPPVGQLDPRGSDLEVAFVLEEVEVPQPLGLGIMDPMHTFDTRCGKPTAGDKVDADGQHLAGGVEINAPHVPRFGDAEGGFKQLVLHPRALASIAECRTMPAFSKARLLGPVGALKGSLRRASPALDRAHRTFLSSPNPLEFQKRPK